MWERRWEQRKGEKVLKEQAHPLLLLAHLKVRQQHLGPKGLLTKEEILPERGQVFPEPEEKVLHHCVCLPLTCCSPSYCVLSMGLLPRTGAEIPFAHHMHGGQGLVQSPPSQPIFQCGVLSYAACMHRDHRCFSSYFFFFGGGCVDPVQSMQEAAKEVRDLSAEYASLNL